MPSARGKRPWAVPKGSTNFACLGQFVETHNDVVFTLKSSVRTARIGVYSLLGLKRQVPDIYPGQYDIRRLLRATRTLNNDKAFLGEGLLRRILGVIYPENILPLGPDEDTADLRRHGLFEQQISALRGLIEENHTLESAKTWVEGEVDALRGRRLGSGLGQLVLSKHAYCLRRLATPRDLWDWIVGQHLIKSSGICHDVPNQVGWQSDAAEHHQGDHDDQDSAKQADPRMTIAVAISCEAATETAEERDNKQYQKYHSQRHHRSPVWLD